MLESVYEEAICYELDKAVLQYKRQQPVSVIYEDIKLDVGFKADIVVDDKIILELKSIESIVPVHAKTLLTYMRLSKLEVGLLINFNVTLLKNGITRLVDDERQTDVYHGAA